MKLYVEFKTKISKKPNRRGKGRNNSSCHENKKNREKELKKMGRLTFLSPKLSNNRQYIPLIFRSINRKLPHNQMCRIWKL